MSNQEYPCTYSLGHTCVHGGCRLATLPPRIAERLKRNWEAQDYARNWGKLLYDPRQHGRDFKRRKTMADVLRSMRKGDTDLVGAVQAGAWIGAALP